MKLTVMGRRIGEFSSWDGDWNDVIYYEVQFREEVKHLFLNPPNTTLGLNSDLGKFLWYDDAGDVIKELDAVEVLHQIEREQEE